jgi:hypothetical protein
VPGDAGNDNGGTGEDGPKEGGAASKLKGLLGGKK